MKNFKLSTYTKFRTSKNIKELWELLHDMLCKYGITSIFYGFTYSAKLTISKGAIEAVWFQSSHPPEYLAYFDKTFNMEDDLTAIHCVTETTPFIWHDESMWSSGTERQIQFMEDSAKFGMEVGVTLPFHFNQGGVAGMGLCTSQLTTDEFDLLWKEQKDEILAIAHVFDELARNEYMDSIYNLTREEIETLSWLSLGEPVKAIGDKIGVSQSRATQYARAARTKLGARNNEQAVCKAVILGLISP